MLFWKCGVKICIVHAYFSFVTSFLHHDHVGQLGGVHDFSNKPYVNQVCSFLDHYLSSFFPQLSLLFEQ